MTTPEDPERPFEEPFTEEEAIPLEEAPALLATPAPAEAAASEDEVLDLDEDDAGADGLENNDADEDEIDDEAHEADELVADAAPAPVAAVTVTGTAPVRAPAPAARPDLLDHQEPLYRECQGYRLRLEPPDLARLRELPGSKGKSDEELGESFFDGQAEKIAASVADDVPAGAELRVVVDPYSRQAFVAFERTIRGILSF